MADEMTLNYKHPTSTLPDAAALTGDDLLNVSQDVPAQPKSVKAKLSEVAQFLAESGAVKEEIERLDTKVDELSAGDIAYNAEQSVREKIDGLNGGNLPIDESENAISIKERADELENRMNGAQYAITFDNKAQLDAWLAGNYAREDGKIPADTNNGLNIYLRDGSADYWFDKENYDWNTANAEAIENETETAKDVYHEQTGGTQLDDYYTKEQSESRYAPKTETAQSVATAQAAAQAASVAIQEHAARQNNPHNVTKEQVGLGDVTNDKQLKESDLLPGEDIPDEVTPEKIASALQVLNTIKDYFNAEGGSGGDINMDNYATKNYVNYAIEEAILYSWEGSY
ncbi:hypothetical protein AGMMS50212_13530 [Spirochaetia bacterium]|nr:hypothetical protein AGMMS50212_13530 [Spirochaetia bacterium]